MKLAKRKKNTKPVTIKSNQNYYSLNQIGHGKNGIKIIFRLRLVELGHNE